MTSKKIKITEQDITNMVKQVLQENLTRGQVEDEIEDYVKSNDFEKRVHNIVVDAFNDFIQNMWSKKSFWTTMLKKR